MIRNGGCRRKKRRPGLAWRTLTVASLLCAVALLISGCGRQEEATLRLYSGAGLRPPVDELVQLFESRHQVKVECVYSGASHLVSQVKLTQTGDLFMPGDVAYVEEAQAEGLILAKMNVCYFEPVILVGKGNPRNINSVEDLLKPEVRLGLGDPRAIPIGRKALKIFANFGISEQAVQEHLKFSAMTVSHLADAVKLGSIDAVIVWDAVAYFYKDDTEVVRIPPERNAISTVAVGILKFTRSKHLAEKFVGLLTSEEGRRVFAKHGYATEYPGANLLGPLFLYCGAGIRPPVAELVALFEKRQNIKMETMYSGSNLLLGQIKLSRKGDLYMPGDMHYVEQAEQEGLIASKKPVCYFIPVILVTKGNPKNIATLRDLLKPGVKLGLGNPQACAIGRKSMKIFAKNGIDVKSVEKNLLFSSLTVNELGNAVKLGTVDAAIVWDATAAYYAKDADVVEIPRAQNIISIIPVAVLSFSEHKELAERFVDFITSEEGRKTFRKHNYTITLDRRLQVFFSGHVQGVGFRAGTRGLARQFEVTGFVRNLKDGRVELVAEGEPDEVKAFLEALKELRKRNIGKTAENWLPATGEFEEFRIGY